MKNKNFISKGNNLRKIYFKNKPPKKKKEWTIKIIGKNNHVVGHILMATPLIKQYFPTIIGSIEIVVVVVYQLTIIITLV